MLALPLVLLALAAAPRQERSLFIIDGRLAGFGATVPPETADIPPFVVTFLNDGNPLRAFFARPRPRTGLGGPADFVPAGVGGQPSGAAPAGPEAGDSAAPGDFAEALPGGIGGGEDSPSASFPFIPAGFGGGSASPVAPLDVIPTPPVVVSPPVPGTVTPPVVTVPAVPEPTTWVMMILGFFGVGALIRRRAATARRTVATLFVA